VGVGDGVGIISLFTSELTPARHMDNPSFCSLQLAILAWTKV